MSPRAGIAWAVGAVKPGTVAGCSTWRWQRVDVLLGPGIKALPIVVAWSIRSQYVTARGRRHGRLRSRSVPWTGFRVGP